MDNVTLNGGKPWTMTAVDKLRELWKAGVPAAQVASVLGRPEAEVRAKASELKLPLPASAV